MAAPRVSEHRSALQGWPQGWFLCAGASCSALFAVLGWRRRRTDAACALPADTDNCGGMCILTNQDEFHCGFCYHMCGALETCIGGMCQCQPGGLAGASKCQCV